MNLKKCSLILVVFQNAVFTAGILITSKILKGCSTHFTHSRRQHTKNILTENMLIENMLLLTRYSEYKYLLDESNSKI